MNHLSLLLLLGIAGLVHMDPVIEPGHGSCPASNQRILNELQTLSSNITDIAKMVNAQNTARDCDDFFKAGFKESGIYYPSVGKPLLCDMNGGWTVFQKRLDGSVDFFRNWCNYREGFGNLEGEFWLGLETLHRITSEKNYMLRVELENFKGERRYAEYERFTIADGKQDYILALGTYNGNAGDGLTKHSGLAFSTKDRDNDRWGDSCAETYKGGWWYNECHASNLNGLYLIGNHTSFGDGVNWYPWTGYHYSLKSTVMKIKSV